MRCPDCNKFVSLENGDPEEQSVEINHQDGDTFHINAVFRLPRNCSECGQELKEGTFEFDFDVDLEGVTEEERDSLIVEADDMDVNETGGGRYAKNVFSLSGNFRITTTEREVGSQDATSDELSAGSFDELC